ncbi:hypothetical protein SAMN04487819_116100 [Actinopolyspora alba]|uniref:Uncharacterized protein n=1 Tax=Actinopolyspora alba TaxID=673379 RepID=A0A1I2BGY0_9ACTN|nr:hypothetical protein [Actinopolyspora alba]SFE55431.1 hypothetical protein SAMN04487819_116100 [Actinopolyspora alba]
MTDITTGPVVAGIDLTSALQSAAAELPAPDEFDDTSDYLEALALGMHAQLLGPAEDHPMVLAPSLPNQVGNEGFAEWLIEQGRMAVLVDDQAISLIASALTHEMTADAARDAARALLAAANHHDVHWGNS